ncbi:ADP-ribosylglycohydrolase family protein [Intrasporangium sp. YIM S08009]|uniref:ADP-ribosylglycohydrolase family protein n=1 Tax=Intrasporangium zincisolvens TaxID=3080018 RepID=UPI002B05E7AE|nr:ADP-ribosylglycohydrolase family protein [Intrasporangium sp. YIM S08009]
MNNLRRRIQGVITGAAVGDALGGATEGYTPEQIQARHGGWVSGIVPPWAADEWATARPIAPYHKGDGHITDDTLMTRALIETYAARPTHLDAYAIAEEFVPRLMGSPTWIPELEREAILLQRIFLAEKWLVARLHYGHVDPREAGTGNIVNCGAAMYMAPVGVVNAADPAAAYAEAIDLAAPHQSSYGREAAGVFAAAVAASLAPGADVTGVVDACLDVAHDGTRAAIEAVVKAATSSAGAPRTELGAALRAAVEPYDTVGPDYRQPALDARRPSRTKAIEELPVALGFVVAHDGDFTGAVLGAVNYGRDSDSIATMAGAVCGGLGGADVVPSEWLTTIETNSRMDVTASADQLAGIAYRVLEGDRARHLARAAQIDTLLGTA